MSRVALVMAVSVALVVSACSSTHHSTSGPAQPSPRPPILAALADIGLLTPASGGGARPELRWATVSGASSYAVTLYSASGPAYWAWSGDSTSVEMGGGGAALPPSAPGPKLSASMTWQVFAYDAHAKMIGASARRAIGP